MTEHQNGFPKVLNLYAGIGGNRKLWNNVDVHEGNMENCHHACCRNCYKDNELEDWEEHYEFWFNTDYNWESKKKHEVVS